MTLMHRALRAIVGVGFLAFLAMPAGAQIGKLVDPNTAARERAAAIAEHDAGHREGHDRAPAYKTVVDLNKFLLEQSSRPTKRRSSYRKAFVPINVNTGTKAESLLIPGVGARMSAEFERIPAVEDLDAVRQGNRQVCRPGETDRLKQYFFIPTS